ncbi:MAG: NAD-binding protein [Gemmatimonadota bacterium]
MLPRLRAYLPYAIAGVIALNGFLNLGAGFASLFQFGRYVELGMDAVPGYLQMAPHLELGGFVGVVLGALLVALGRGLADRRRRSWWWAVGILALLLGHDLYRGLTVQTAAPSALLMALLVAFRADFDHRPERRRWSFAEVVAGAAVVFALGFGIVGSYLLRHEFSTISGWTDAVYFTVVTYSTLGFGDILPQTANAKIYTVCMLFIGLGTFATALTVLIAPMIEERIRGVFSAMTRFQRTVDHVVVCGYTNVTESILDELREREVPFIVIEERESVYQMLQGSGVDVLHGDPTERRVLEQANLPHASAVIAATDSDATNALITITARTLREIADGVHFRIIARVEDEENIQKVGAVGADEVISPSTLGGRLMAARAVGEGKS